MQDQAASAAISVLPFWRATRNDELTIDAAVFVPLVEAVILKDVKQARHLAENQAARISLQKLGQ